MFRFARNHTERGEFNTLLHKGSTRCCTRSFFSRAYCAVASLTPFSRIFDSNPHLVDHPVNEKEECRNSIVDDGYTSPGELLPS